MLITLDEMIVHRISMIVIAKYHVKATRRVLADLPPPTLPHHRIWTLRPNLQGEGVEGKSSVSPASNFSLMLFAD